MLYIRTCEMREHQHRTQAPSSKSPPEYVHTLYTYLRMHYPQMAKFYKSSPARFELRSTSLHITAENTPTEQVCNAGFSPNDIKFGYEYDAKKFVLGRRKFH